MIRVLYTWSVPAERSEAFRSAWRKTTRNIHQTVDGALGSFCLAGIDDRDEVLTVALWESEAQWRRFIQTAKTDSMKSLHDLAEQISVKAYTQVGDETVHVGRPAT